VTRSPLPSAGALASALQGVRVVDLTAMVAGPMATMMLADLGADVVKVERAGHGDDARRLPPFWPTDGDEPEDGAIFVSLNRNKRSLQLDLKRPAALDAVLRLVDTADVFVESFRPGKVDQLGLSYKALRERNPGLVYCSISAFGRGPLGHDLPGYDPVIQAFTGVMDANGHPDGEPARVAPSIVDLTTGMWATTAIMAALQARVRTGEGCHVEATLVDTGFTLMNHQLVAFLATGDPPRRTGSATAFAAPYEAFRAADGRVMIAAGNDGVFGRLCSALDLLHLPRDPRFVTVADRRSNRADLHAVIEARLVEMTTAEIERTLGGHGVPVSAVNRLDDALRTDLAAERELLQTPRDAPTGPRAALLARLPILPPDVPLTWPPRLGEHSEAVLREAGLDESQIAEALGVAYAPGR
jgi:crotonobetainyl-CoA:carnitine CoA-transferase CaiB-like acyl-CoA transferase